MHEVNPIRERPEFRIGRITEKVRYLLAPQRLPASGRRCAVFVGGPSYWSYSRPRVIPGTREGLNLCDDGICR